MRNASIRLNLDLRSFSRGEYEGKPCAVIYDALMDKTLVITDKSERYSEVMHAIEVMESAGELMPKVLSQIVGFESYLKPDSLAVN